MLTYNLIQYDLKEYSGKSFMCVFFTRFCGVGCPFCFFKSAPARDEVTIADQFNEMGIDKFIEFCNQANLGYVLVSGGGEPLTQKKAVLRTIAEVKSDRIVLVTSGNWAMSKHAAIRYLQEIEEAMIKRLNPCKVTVRVSVSEGHGIKLGIAPAKNLIEIFQEKYIDHPYLRFQIHAFENDSMLNQVLSMFPGHSVEISTEQKASDDEQVIKVIPKKINVTFPSGYRIIVGISKIFGSDLRPNLHREHDLKKTIQVFDQDLEESEDNNSAVLYNVNGAKGLDWSLNYNGNICLWQNQVNDNQWNIYEDSFDQVLNSTFKDPITLSYTEKGCKYRERIVAEVSPRSVLRVKSISLRDYAGTVIFEEEKTRLYYAIRVIQDYFAEGRTIFSELNQLPEELLKLIHSNVETVKKLYHEAEYTIVDQYKRRQFNVIEWRDLLELIKLGHYDLTEEQIAEAVGYYNDNVLEKKYKTLNDVDYEKGESIQKRLTERLMFMKPSALKNFSRKDEIEMEQQMNIINGSYNV